MIPLSFDFIAVELEQTVFAECELAMSCSRLLQRALVRGQLQCRSSRSVCSAGQLCGKFNYSDRKRAQNCLGWALCVIFTLEDQVIKVFTPQRAPIYNF